MDVHGTFALTALSDTLAVLFALAIAARTEITYVAAPSTRYAPPPPEAATPARSWAPHRPGDGQPP